ncbi:hypothetical protein DYQ86_23900 [Acidobacteria bacterium AB60]|nr:hypothetical protein DYQ86_23900 [Acidobacteria bacterium AB60]
MKRFRGGVFAAAAFLPSLICGFRTSALHQLALPMIATAAPVYLPLAALDSGERFPQGSKLVLLQDGQTKPIIDGFAQTADSNLSFDAERLLFAGKRTDKDRWSIWEYAFADRSVRQVIAGESDLIRPLYLPADRIVYSRKTSRGFQMEAAGRDGSGVLPLTFMDASAIPEFVLADGRILFQAGFPLGTSLGQGAVPELFLVYSDGSGVESYRCDHGSARWGGGQLSSGDVVFTHGTELARFTSPLAGEAQIAAPAATYAGSPFEAESGAWVVSARSATEGHYAVHEWRPGMALRLLYALKDEDLVQPIPLAPHKRPNRHPTALHKWDYANLLALDSRRSREGDLTAQPTTVRLESLDAGGRVALLGTSPVEADGSFFVEVPGDRPIRFALLDDKGAVLRAERGWFWIRKGEQRYCVGCHAGPEHAPENRVPQVLLRTTTPVDLTGALGHFSRGGQ